MATDFYQRQSEARKSTAWLIVMFCLAVIAIVAVVVAVTVFVVETQITKWPPGSEWRRIGYPAIAGVITTLIVLGGSFFKIVQLRSGGGTSVAEGLGGRRVYPNTSDPVQRRLLNVVEEMAIASGTPVPPVFMMDEDGINAFAAGYSSSDAVLGVTRGCAEKLTRDELQGVVAHEFSHMLNGDMRMSIRLIGILHGILLIGLTGQLIFRMFLFSGHNRSRSDSRRDGGGGQIVLLLLAIGVIAIVLGFLGKVIGGLIKAAVSRQREYLADASAVQFTRNPSGIADALKRIGGSVSGSRLDAANAAEASHMFFSEGVRAGITGLMATHPPLPKRIRAIEPNWDGNYLRSAAPTVDLATKIAAGFAGSGGRPQHDDTGEVPLASLEDSLQHIGDVTTAHQHYAAGVLQDLPGQILDCVHEPYGARAVVYALMLDSDDSIRRIQVTALEKDATPDVVRLVHQLQPAIDDLDVRARLPLIDLSLPALRAMSARQYANFTKCFVALAQADRKIDLFEWTLSQVLTRHLRPQFQPVSSPRIHYYGLQHLSTEVSVLLSAVAASGNTHGKASEAFRAGAKQLPEITLTQSPPDSLNLKLLRQSLDKLDQVSAKHRGRMVEACAAAVCADQHVQWQEAELLRGIADLLDCPMPPLLVPRK